MATITEERSFKISNKVIRLDDIRRFADVIQDIYDTKIAKMTEQGIEESDRPSLKFNIGMIGGNSYSSVSSGLTRESFIVTRPQ